MKVFSRFVFLMIVPLICSTMHAQILSKGEIDRLYYTAKVWGYYKYFHTEVAKGSYNWDSVLIQTLPMVLNASSDEAYRSALLTMIKMPAPFLRTTPTPTTAPESLKFNLNLSWITDPTFSAELVDSFTVLKTWNTSRSNYYVGQAFVNGNPTFDNDKQFYQLSDTLLPSLDQRLLGLFRYWNIINYFYPYKNLMDQPWDATLKEFIPLIVDISTYGDYVKTWMRLRTRLNDAHASLSSQYFPTNYSYYLPFKLRMVENKTVVTKILDSSTIAPGDIILKINGTDITAFRDSLSQFIQGSNHASKNRNIHTFLLRGAQNQPVILLLETASGIKEIIVKRSLISTSYYAALLQTGPIWKILEPISTGKKIGYVDMERLTTGMIQQMFSDLAETDQIIIDLRNYPQGTLWPMIGYLFNAPIHIANFTVPDIKNPGTLFWYSENIGSNFMPIHYKNNVVLLFNEETQSQAEYTIMGFEQHPPATKVGSQTAGGDGNVSAIYLPGGLYSYFTGLGNFYPDYTPTQRIGIIPDVYVYPTIKGIRDGKDEELEEALPRVSVAYRNESVYQFSLSQNYPNPFNPATTIEFSIPIAGFTTVKIYDMIGREVETLVAGEMQPGTYQTTWNAGRYASGMYLCTMQSGAFHQIRKIVLQK